MNHSKYHHTKTTRQHKNRQNTCTVYSLHFYHHHQSSSETLVKLPTKIQLLARKHRIQRAAASATTGVKHDVQAVLNEIADLLGDQASARRLDCLRRARALVSADFSEPCGIDEVAFVGSKTVLLIWDQHWGNWLGVYWCCFGGVEFCESVFESFYTFGVLSWVAVLRC